MVSLDCLLKGNVEDKNKMVIACKKLDDNWTEMNEKNKDYSAEIEILQKEEVEESKKYDDVVK